jgi:prepilin-type N-terminal cleavage/methylation domain-containing protein
MYVFPDSGGLGATNHAAVRFNFKELCSNAQEERFMRKKEKKGFTLIELLVVVAIIALLISILLPSLSRARELAKRVKCGAQLNGMGKSYTIYANDFAEAYPVPPFSETSIGEGSSGPIDYTGPGGEVGTANASLNRNLVSKTDADAGGAAGSGTKRISTTRSFWILVRQGEVTVAQFLCPSSSDVEDDTQEIERYYDFVDWNRVSYGYQVPYGPGSTRPSTNIDARMPIMADKGPFSSPQGGPMPWPPPATLDLNSSPSQWTRYNSGNHGGRGAGEGQEILFADGHVDFQRKPTVGIANDNIYTLMNDNASTTGRIIGAKPDTGPPPNPYPGENTFGTDSDSASDALIYP